MPKRSIDDRLRSQGYSDADIKRLRRLRKEVTKARRFPVNTCPASRHLHMMADYLITDGAYTMLAEEPAHCAESMLAVLCCLWELRTKYAGKEIPK